MKKFFRALVDLVFPFKCQICKQEKPEPFCEDCLHKIKYISPPFCATCGKPEDKYFIAGLCRECAPKRMPFNKARSLGIYDGPLKKAIHQLKFKGKKTLATTLGKLLVDHMGETGIDLEEIDMLVPVPLSEGRLKSRGFNQSDLLSEIFSRYYNIPYDGKVLIRQKDTAPQFDLKRHLRFENVKDAFKVTNNEKISGKSILLIDDIYTTGSTVSECSKVLRESGAEKVFVLTLSRAIEN